MEHLIPCQTCQGYFLFTCLKLSRVFHGALTKDIPTMLSLHEALERGISISMPFLGPNRVCTVVANGQLKTAFPFMYCSVLTAVCNSRREVDMNVHVVLYLRACTYRYRCLISKICVLLTQIFFDMCIAVCLPGQLVNRYSFCVSDDLFYITIMKVIYSLHYYVSPL